MPRRPGRPRGSAPSSVREVLHRNLYRGVIEWNRTARIVRQGARAQRARPAGDVVRVTMPELTIVDDALWTAAQARMAAGAEIYRQRTGGRAFGRPANGVASPYLLTGVGACAACGGSMAVLQRGPRGHRLYGCMTRHLRGDAVCGNALKVRLDDADSSVLTAIERDVLRVDVLETALYKAMRTMQAPPTNGKETPGAELQGELTRLEVEVNRLTRRSSRAATFPPWCQLSRSGSDAAPTSVASSPSWSVGGRYDVPRTTCRACSYHACGAHRLAGDAPPGAAARAAHLPCTVGGSTHVHAACRLLHVRGGGHDHTGDHRRRRRTARGGVAPGGFEPPSRP
jgi:hypothetical protein